MPEASASNQPRRGPWAAGVQALRRFHRPFLLIQLAAVLLVVAYRASAGVRAACVALAAMKVQGGLPFAAATAAFAGGVLPEIAKAIAAVGRRRGPNDGREDGHADGRAPAPRRLTDRVRDHAFNLAFFAFNGVVIDLLYRGEARLFGNEGSFLVVAAKVAFDQFLFTPSWLPIIIALYLWRANGFRASATLAAARRGGGGFPAFYRARVLPLLLPDWCFWIPMVSIVYALPGPLQFLLFVLALGAWSLIMVFIATPETTPEAQA